MDLIKRDYHIALFDTYKELLTTKQQEYFVLYYYEDYTLKEIAQITGYNLNTVKSRLYAGLKKLKNIVGEDVQ